MLRWNMVLLSGLCFLAACGSGGSGDAPAVDPSPVPDPDPAFITVPATMIEGIIAINYQPPSDTVTFGSDVFTNTNVSGLARGVATYNSSTVDGAAAEYVVRGVSPSGEATALVWGNQPTGYRLSRLEEAQLPVNGTLVYTNGGDNGSRTPNYSGVYERDFGGSESWGHMTGSARIRLELDDGNITGGITQRQNTGGAMAQDMTFETSNVDFGTFSTTGTLAELVSVAGGQFATDAGSGNHTGHVAGLITTDDGSEGLFTVYFRFTTEDAGGNPVTHTEFGAFSADRFTLCTGC